MQAKSFSLGAQEYLLEAVAVRCGDDLTVVIGGGEKQHIGAVAVGVPRPSLKDKNIVSSSASVLCLTGHKEDLLARKAALELARMLGHTVTVTVGLHIDDASAEEIAMLEANFQELLRQICLWAAAVPIATVITGIINTSILITKLAHYILIHTLYRQFQIRTVL